MALEQRRQRDLGAVAAREAVGRDSHRRHGIRIAASAGSVTRIGASSSRCLQ